MRDLTSIIVALYMLVSIVSGIVTAVRKRAQTQGQGTRGKPVLVPRQPVAPGDEQIPQMVLADFDDTEASIKQRLEVTEEHLSPRARPDPVDGAPGSWNPNSDALTREDLLSASWDEDTLDDETDLAGSRATWDDDFDESPGDQLTATTRVMPALAARHLVSDRDRLQAAVIAAEVLERPRALRVWTNR